MSALAEWELLLALPIDRALPWAERERRKDQCRLLPKLAAEQGSALGRQKQGCVFFST